MGHGPYALPCVFLQTIFLLGYNTHKTISIGLTERFVPLFGPRVEIKKLLCFFINFCTLLTYKWPIFRYLKFSFQLYKFIVYIYHIYHLFWAKKLFCHFHYFEIFWPNYKYPRIPVYFSLIECGVPPLSPSRWQRSVIFFGRS